MPLHPNTHLGRYEIRSLLGVGGMGEVYLAEDTTLRRLVAIKLLPAEFTADRDRLHRFEREASAASSLNHPNILTIHEIGVESGHHFIATEFIDGESLRQRLEDRRPELNEVLEIGVQVASALSAAHEARIVHRDIKPENIMVRKDGIVKVLDFGLAKLVEQDQEGATDADAPTKVLYQTAPGILMGTVSYMSPEQAHGKEVDTRTDIWSLGVVLYEMIAGRLPFEGETMTGVLASILRTEPPPLTHLGTHIPAELDRIVTKALRKDKEERYQVVKDLGLDLKSLKQRLEFEAERERTGTPEQSGQTQIAATTRAGGVTTVGTPETAARPTGQEAGGDIHTTSSAEYIVTEIKRHKLGAAMVLAVLLSAIAGLAYFYSVRSGKASINSVAVMPLVNVGKDPDTEYLSDGISESLINNLSQLPQLKVIARTSTFRYKGKEIDPEEVAKTLGVGAIVTGRIIQRGDELQVSVELMNVQDKTQMWGEQYNRRATDLQSVQAEIARTISEKLRLRLTGAQEQQLAKRATQNPEAYQLYLNGLFYQRKGNNVENFKKALDYFTQAVALDPKFALAYTGMPFAYLNLSTTGEDPAEMLAKAQAAAQKALELDESLAEAHHALAIIKRNEWDWSGAESGFRRTIELNPNLAAAHGNYANYLSIMGRTAEALAGIRRAQELDPLRLGFKAVEGAILYRARRYDEAIQINRNAVEIQPDDANAHVYLGYMYAARGQYAEAIAGYQKNISLNGERPSTLCYLGYAYAMSGKRGEALAILDKLKATKEHVSPAELAILHVGLGDKEAALESLERAYQAHDLQMQFLKVEPHYDALRSEARFQNLMRRVGLQQ
jgi:serine/threonine protein kinase/TolB-like protein/Flp pilus assembly protein TadD